MGPLIPRKSRWVKYYNLTRFLGFSHYSGQISSRPVPAGCSPQMVLNSKGIPPQNPWIQVLRIFPLLSRWWWWQLRYFLCSPRKFGEDGSNLTSTFFQMGWFNHQLVILEPQNCRFWGPGDTPAFFRFIHPFHVESPILMCFFYMFADGWWLREFCGCLICFFAQLLWQKFQCRF